VVGGVSLFGGTGTVLGSMIGAALIASISNLMNVLNVSAYWQPLVIGVIILGAVTFDTMRSARRLSLPWAQLLMTRIPLVSRVRSRSGNAAKSVQTQQTRETP
jgi:ribose transport system permease protein